MLHLFTRHFCFTLTFSKCKSCKFIDFLDEWGNYKKKIYIFDFHLLKNVWEKKRSHRKYIKYMVKKIVYHKMKKINLHKIRYSIIFHDLAHCDSSSEPEVESWQWRTSTGRSSKPPSFKQILVHPSLCVWTSALTIDALKIEFQAYIFNIFIYHISYMLDVDYHMHILK